MKIKETMLLEAVRFGNQQMNVVRRHKNQFRIGIEYELKIRDDLVSGQEYMEDVDVTEDHYASTEVKEATRNEIKRLWGDELDALSKWMGHIASPTFEAAVEGVLDALDMMQDGVSVEENISSVRKIVDTFITPAPSIPQLDSFLENSLTQGLSSGWGVRFSVRNLLSTGEDFFEFLPPLVDILEEERSDYVNSPETVQAVESMIELINDFSLDLSDFSDSIIGGFNDVYSLTGFLLRSDDMLEDMNISEVRNTTAMSVARRWAAEGSDEGSALAYIEGELDSYVNGDMIYDIVPDGSIKTSEGGEVITNPLDVDDAFNTMEEMFEFIDENGYTDADTGMHVNISHRKFRSIQDLNLLKLVILIDPDHIQSKDHGGWAERNYMVQNLYRRISHADIRELASMVAASEYQGNDLLNLVENYLSNLVTRPEKFRSINFVSAVGNVDLDQKRIEFRYFGGKDYHKRIDQIKRDVYFACYCVLAMVDKEFLKREYYEQLFKTLNRLTRDRFRMTFFDLVDAEKKILLQGKNLGTKDPAYSRDSPYLKVRGVNDEMSSSHHKSKFGSSHYR